jgi:exosortase
MNVTRRGRSDAQCVALIVASIAVTYGPVLTKLVRQWLDDENASHGLIVVPLAVYLAWRARHHWRRAEPRPVSAGLAAVAVSLLIYVAGILGAELYLSRISIVGVLAGATIFVWGWNHLRLIAFPLTLVALAVPLPAILLNQITFPLQLVASRLGEGVIAVAGVPVLREGNLLILADTALEVAEACSGIRSLVSLVTVAVVAAYFRGGSRAGGAALVMMSVPIAVIANAARVAGTGLAAHVWGPEVADGFFHTFSGWVVFIVAACLLVLSERVVARLERSGPYTHTAEVTCAPAP